MEKYTCARCGLDIHAGKVRYIMTVTYVADVDYRLPESGPDAQAEIAAALEKIESASEEELMNRVYQKQVFVLCAGCKSIAAESLFPGPASDAKSGLQ